MSRDIFYKFFGIPAITFGDFLKYRMDLNQFSAIHDIAGVTDRKKWFDAAGSAGNDADGAGWGNGGGGGVSHERSARTVIDAFLEIREGTAFLSNLLRCSLR